MASNIDTAVELNKLLHQQNQLYADQAKMIKGQMAMMRQMVEMLRSLDPRTLTEGWGELQGAMGSTQEQLEAAGESGQQNLGSLGEIFKESSGGAQVLGKSLKSVGKGMMALSVPMAIVRTLGNIFDMAASAATGMVGVLGTVVDSLKNVAISIITAPFKLLHTLMNETSGGGSELRQNLENIRKAFGDLNTGASKAIIGMARSMKGELNVTGLSTYRIFGNLAERLATITEYATQLGSMFNNLSTSLLSNAEAFGAYVKGLGLTEAGMKGVGRLALSTGTSFTEVGREITTMAFGMGEAFNINGTQISRAVGDMLNDVKNFGSLSIKQLTSVAVFANRLGLEFQDLQGTIDQFDNFEQAADAAAQLSQAFGLNVDALALVQEQDPAARFESLRKAFFQTGRSVEQMTRQEMRLLASQTGLSEEAVKLGFSLENQGTNYADVQKQADLTQKKQLTQAESMQKLANSIERLVKSGSALQGGFFEIFFQGFLRGIRISGEFRGMMRALHQTMRIVFQAGRQLGGIFVDVFPGVSQVLEGIREYFNPAAWRKMMKGVVGAFRDFFGDITTDPQAGLKNLYTRLKTIFFDNFSSKTAAGQKVIGGFGLFFRTIFNVAKAAIEIAIRDIRQRVTNVFTEGTTENGLAMGALKMLRRMRDAILDFPWRETLGAIKESLLTWFTEAAGGVDWNEVATTVTDMLMDSLRFSLKALKAIGGVLLDIFHEIEWGTLATLVGAGLLVVFGPSMLSALGGFLMTSISSFIMTTLLPAMLTGLELAGSAMFSAIGGWPVLIVAALAAAGLAFLEWGDDLMDYASEALDEFGPMLASAIEEYLPVILEGLYNFLSNLPALFMEAIEWIGSAIKSSVEWLITSVSNLFTSSGNLDSALTRFFGRIGAAIGNVFSDFLKTHFPNLYAGLERVQNFFEGLRILAGRVLDGMITWKRRYIDPVVAGFSDAWQTIRGGAQNFIRDLGSRFDGFITGVKNGWQQLTTAMEPVLSIVRQFIDLLPSIGGSTTSGPLSQARAMFESITNLGAESQRVAATTTQETTAAMAASARAAAGAVQDTATKTNAALKNTAQQATVTTQAASASVQGAAGASAAAAGGGTSGSGGLLDSILGAAAPSSEAQRRRTALEELSSIKAPSPARVARMERDIQRVTDIYTKGIVNNVRDLVAAVNTVTTDLNTIGDSPARINVQLRQLANHLGVGGTQRLEIQNRNFTIAMNVTVVLDADDFEQALISRPGEGTRFVVNADRKGS